ncbi:ABC transporter substrate-binding protein [Dactylosporangium sp. NPDC051484]|uniref:ABC transporter substrate-binding protein n=1 Tax=Dactylosporangium sp. NPDC051484 TaxID=3154942 RepID=UPI00344E795A
MTGIAVLTACGGGSTDASSGSAGKTELRIGLQTAGTSLNPAVNGSGSSTQISALTNAAITHIQPDGSVSPGLATSWHYVGSGNTQFQFTLRQDAKFSDGSPVTSQAVKGWLEYFAKAGGSFAKSIPISSIDTTDDHTVVLHLSSPNPIVPYLLSEVFNIGFVASPAAVADPASLATNPAGAGPYQVVPSESVANDHYTFVPNKHYYDQSKIKYNKVTVKIIPQASTMLAALQSNQLDVASGDVSTAEAASSAGFNVVSGPFGWAGILIIDRSGTTSPALADVRVRQALNYAVDRKAIASGVLGKGAIPTSQPITTDGYDPSYDDYYSYDPDKAKALLSAAGYGNGFSLNVICPVYYGAAGCPLTEAVAQDLSKVGVKLTVKNNATQSEHVKLLVGGTYPAAGFLQNPNVPMFQLYGFDFAPKAVLNHPGWNDPTLDKLWQDGSAAADPAPYWKQMTARVVTEAYQLPIASTVAHWYVAKHVTGVKFSPASSSPLPTEWSPN